MSRTEVGVSAPRRASESRARLAESPRVETLPSINATGPHMGGGGAWVVGCAFVNDGATAQATVADPRTGTVASEDPPEPILPEWNGPCLHRVVPTLLDHLARPGATPLPPWFPAPVAEARQIVLLLLDGLGAEQLHQRAGLAPTLQAATGTAMTTVAPSTTACALTTLVTGRVPADHGVVGYRVALDGEVMNVLQWSIHGSDARIRVPA